MLSYMRILTSDNPRILYKIKWKSCDKTIFQPRVRTTGCTQVEFEVQSRIVFGFSKPKSQINYLLRRLDCAGAECSAGLTRSPVFFYVIFNTLSSIPPCFEETVCYRTGGMAALALHGSRSCRCQWWLQRARVVHTPPSVRA